MTNADTNLYGVLAEFATDDALRNAVRQVREAGYEKFDAFTPYQSEPLDEELGGGGSRVAPVILICAILGGAAAYALQLWINFEAYPLNVGGRPLHSWPAFIPATFECTVLAASFGALLGMLIMNGLPRPHHPLFAIPRFADHASRDAFFVCIEAGDERFDPAETAAFLTSLGAKEVWDVAE